jgi:hypothetical protein
MKLLRVELSGYRRFRDRAAFSVDSDVVAIVAPNESGKSSVLDGLAHLNDNDEAFRPSELSRGMDVDEDHDVVTATFLLEEDDRDALGDVHEAAVVRLVTVAKTASGVVWMDFHPVTPTRDARPRAKAIQALRRAAGSPSLRDLEWPGDGGDAAAARLSDLAETLAGAEADLDAETLRALREGAAGLTGLVAVGAPAYLHELPRKLEALATTEGVPSPAERASEILFDRVPRFEWFDDDARSLSSSYDLTRIGSAVPAALKNLARVAGLDIEALANAVAQSRRAEIQEIAEAANSRLREHFAGTWTQGDLAVSLSVEGNFLRLFVRESSGSYWSLQDRSDGLRWFVALVSLLASRDDAQAPILLVDEAEQHLHYDAQADLVQMFYMQAHVAGIIYTTHSAGCLPHDLGTGVKVVKRTGHHQSTLRNGFWVDDAGTVDDAGFSSVLMQMGASTLAFSAARYAVLCEGRTDLILLPSLLREACEWTALPFQIVPGLASITPFAIPDLDLVAARVAFLIDNDASGRAIARKLRQGGVPTDRVFRLPAARSNTATLEDFVDPKVHKAVLEDLIRRSGEARPVPQSLFSAFGRQSRLETWFARQRPSVRTPNKAVVAHELVSRARAGTAIADPRRVAALRSLAEGLRGALGAPEPRHARPAVRR